MKMMRYIMPALLAGLMVAPSAIALSCVRPDIIQDLNRAKQSEKLYHIFVGRFEAPQVQHNRLDLLRQSWPPRDNSKTVDGRFTGYSLTSNPADDVQLNDHPVQIHVTCAGSWCGNVPKADQEIIAFVEVPDGELGGEPSEQLSRLTRGPCTSMSYVSSPDKVEKVRACLDTDCAPDDFWSRR